MSFCHFWIILLFLSPYSVVGCGLLCKQSLYKRNIANDVSKLISNLVIISLFYIFRYICPFCLHKMLDTVIIVFLFLSTKKRFNCNHFMKINKSLLSILIVYFTVYSFSAVAQVENCNYSIKNRWTIKASLSRYKTAFDLDNKGYAIVSIGDFFQDRQNHKMVNFKLETNYGITKFIEVGIFAGFQHYEWLNEIGVIEIESDVFIPKFELKKSFAPLFGANINFHVLPFLLKSQKCYWDLYLTAKYGGCYLPYKEWSTSDFLYGKYRQEYGLGVGVCYYIKNIIGFFAEGSIGQFAFFPNFNGVSGSESNLSFRIGIAAKIN